LITSVIVLFLQTADRLLATGSGRAPPPSELGGWAVNSEEFLRFYEGDDAALGFFSITS